MTLFVGGFLLGVGVGVALAGCYSLWRNRPRADGACPMCGRK